jgi:serine/threonine protein kinase
VSGLRRPGPAIDGLEYIGYLGAGGYADVYLYERLAPRLKVAVKVLHAGALTAQQARQFEAEAEVMAELADHPHIVQVISTGMTSDDRPYLLMRYYPENLAQQVHGRPMSVPAALRTGIQISSAVETVHRRGIIHRDIKPANVLLSPFGVPALSDFGIAGRALDADTKGEFGVSVPWTAPEVLAHRSDGSVVADVYSFAATLWHLLVGRSPFEIPGGDNSLEAIYHRVLHVDAPVTGRAEVSEHLERLLLQGLAKDPQKRPRSALEFLRGLQSVERAEQLTPTPPVVAQEEREVVKGDAASRWQEPTAERYEVNLRQPPTQVTSGHADPTVVRPHRVAPGGSPETSQILGTTQEVDAGRWPAETSSDTHPPPGSRVGSDGRVERRRSARPYVAAVVVVVITLGTVVYLATDQGAGNSPEHTTQIHPRTTSPLGRGGPTPAPGQPIVEGRVLPGSGKVKFTWTYSRGRAGDTFRWSTRPGGALSRRVTSPSLILPVRSTGRTCISVEVVRADDAPSMWSDLRCA